ncbi:hypothetical protein EO157G_3210 [Escherichia phage SP27]|uniref:Uncharacterized protein n=1 Tax=Escherichia phage SP27 TaxID=2495557 RepID=A0A5A4U5W5_9CAUD|nr:hypothetical protein EO157G_3210 [Escherichia phage SP27]
MFVMGMLLTITVTGIRIVSTLLCPVLVQFIFCISSESMKYNTNGAIPRTIHKTIRKFKKFNIISTL